MAHQLATATQEPKFRVAGIVMIDTVLLRHLLDVVPRSGPTPPPAPPADDVPVVKSAEELRTMSLREKVDLNMKHAGMMGRFWDMPRWGDAAGGARVPPTVLLRARDHVGPDAGFDFPVPVDHCRDQLRMLGWEKYAEEVGQFIENVVDLDGHHFSIFEFDKVFPFFSSPTPKKKNVYGCYIPHLSNVTILWIDTDKTSFVDRGRLGKDQGGGG